MLKNSFKWLQEKRFFLSLSILFMLLASALWLFSSNNANAKLETIDRLKNAKSRVITPDKDGSVNKKEIMAVEGINILHSFAGGAGDGAKPTGSLILSGSTFYGMTGYGGANNLGTIFKMQTNGTGFTLLHEFADGWEPMDSLFLFGSTLYGTTTWYPNYYPNEPNEPKLFKIQTNGSGYERVSCLCGGDYNYDSWGIDSMAISDTTLYVLMVYKWHYNWSAAIYRRPMDGSPGSIEPFYDTSSSAFDGSLIISGSTLYGTIIENKFDGKKSGTIFSMPIDSNYCYEMHAIDDKGNLILSGSTLYGMTQAGGSGKKGTIYKIETDGSGYTLLHEFEGGTRDGAYPEGSLLIAGSTLYGMTAEGGANNKGTIFKIQTDGSDFALIHSFAGGSTDGAYPLGPLVISGTTLYGMTKEGGASNKGVIFSLLKPNIASISVASPNGGEQWTEGDTQEIAWKSTGTIANVNIDYSTNNGDNWSSVVTNTANDNYIWTLPNTPSTQCLVRVSYAADTNISDVSDAVFSILMSLDLQAERREVRAFSILRQYGKINFLGGDAGVQVAQYRIMRRKGIDNFTLLRTVAPSELQNNQFQLQDKYLEKDITYIYRVEAYDGADQLIGISLEKTI